MGATLDENVAGCWNQLLGKEKYQTFLRGNLDESVSQKTFAWLQESILQLSKSLSYAFHEGFVFPGGSNCRTRSTWSPKSQGRPRPRRTPFVPWLNREGTIRLWLFRGWLVEFVSSVYCWSWWLFLFVLILMIFLLMLILIFMQYACSCVYHVLLILLIFSIFSILVIFPPLLKFFFFFFFWY